MKLREYMNLVEPGAEITCWDKDVDSEFYFYSKESNKDVDPQFISVDLCNDAFIDVLDVVKIREDGVEVNLYDVLNNPVILQYAKDHLYDEGQYEDDDDLALLLFDDNVKNFAYGYEEFSESMVECLNKAYGDVPVMSNFAFDDGYLYFTVEADEYELEGLFRVYDPGNGPSLTLVSVDYGDRHPVIAEKWSQIERRCKELSIEKYTEYKSQNSVCDVISRATIASEQTKNNFEVNREARDIEK